MSHWREKIIAVVTRMLFACERALVNQNTSHWPIRCQFRRLLAPSKVSFGGKARGERYKKRYKSESTVKICIPTVKVTYTTSFINMLIDAWEWRIKWKYFPVRKHRFNRVRTRLDAVWTLVSTTPVERPVHEQRSKGVWKLFTPWQS